MGSSLTGEHRGRRTTAFTLVCLVYLTVTVGEQLLSPLFPAARQDLGIDLAWAGIAFGLLTAVMAAANLLGGIWLGRPGSGPTIVRVAAVATAAGAVAAATATSLTQLLLAQALLGAGAGLFFPAGLQAVALLAGPGRRGVATGLYGVAFSLGLMIAALLGAAGTATNWRAAFWAAAGLALAAAAAASPIDGALRPAGNHARSPDPDDDDGGGGAGGEAGDDVRAGVPWRAVVGLPTVVGSVGAVGQYGAVPFVTTYAVEQWGLAAPTAALLLAASRAISIGAKVVASAGADRVGPLTVAGYTAAVLTVTGVAWVWLPGGWVTWSFAALNIGAVSALFPLANLLAVERFAHQGAALGVYRSAQIGIGALTGALIGLAAQRVGLRPVLAAVVCVPLALVWVARHRAARSAPGSGRPAPTTAR